MKKITTLFAFMMLASIAFTSCDSATSDAKKMAQIQCKIDKLYKEGGKSDEIKKLRDEIQEISKKYDKKVDNMSKKERKAFEKKMRRAAEDEYENCESND
jgi:Skp family chaperone for outer membrane proteins